MERLVDSLFALMTLEEKLGQLTQLSSQSTDAGPRVRAEDEARIRAGQVGSFLGIYGAAYTRRLQRIAVQGSRLKIPLLFAYDVIHGFRTIFPVPLAEAASWDPAAVERSARVASVEATGHGLHWTFAPMVDIARDPRWGRIVEGAGEDPYLGAALAAARVRGFQGTDLAAPNTMLATAKHFAAYGAAEGGRDYNTVDLSPQTLHGIYMRPFQAAAAAGVGSVMASFNEVNGVPMHANADLINGVLRGRWGWDGVVVSDWNGIQELMPHGVAASRAEAGALGLHAGVDVDMVSEIYGKDVSAAVRSGQVTQHELNEAVRRVLQAKYRVGLFQDPYRYSDVEREREVTLTADHRAAARDVARRSIVLLKNQGKVLPLSKSSKTIAVIGTLAADAGSALGSWSADGRKEEAVSVLDGIRRALPSAQVLYARGAEVEGTDTSGFAEAVRVARRADAVILVLGERREMSGEANNRASIELPGMQEELAKRVQAAGRPVVVALMNGRPLAIPWLDQHIPAILETWYLGTEMGYAVADVIFGDYNPGGKLPVTFPRATGQIPLYYNHKNTGRPSSEKGNTSKYLDVPWTPLYPFGHGLSYTTFTYSTPQLSRRSMRATDTLVIQMVVPNTGQRAGDEVVQLYLRDDVASVTRPVKELRGFRRITLRPREHVTVTFTLRADDLAFYDRRMNRVVEPGGFTVFVGGGSSEVKEARFEVTTGAQLGDARPR